MQELLDIQKKYSITDKDLYVLSKLSADLKTSSLFEKEKVNAKIRSVLAKYNVGMLDKIKTIKALTNSNYHNNPELIEKYKDSEKTEELNIAGKKGKQNLIIVASVFVAILIAFSLSKDKKSYNSTNKTEAITFDEAKQFMRTRLSNVNQTLMASKTVVFDGKKIYMFMSVAEDGSTCISGVSEFNLEVMSTNCGNTEIKIQEWNNL